jgi:hypothetical protein
MSRSASLLLCAMLVAPQSSAEIFKCVGKDGLDLYQNFPCPFESLGFVPMNMQAQKAPSSAPNSSQPNAKALAQGTTLVGGSGSPQQPEPRLGMTTEEVRAVWGEPTETLWEEPGVGDRSELWSYGNSRSVRFVKNRVSAIQK